MITTPAKGFLPMRMGMGCLLALLATMGISFRGSPCQADEPHVSLAITSISVADTNLVLDITVPANTEKVVLETQATLDRAWTACSTQTVTAGAGEVTFTIPKPSTSTAFFRVSASQNGNQTPVVSSELQYVAMPSLNSQLAPNGDAIFHFQGVVDGSDRIVITRDGALWQHVNWNWPKGPVNVNGIHWNPREKNYATTAGKAQFLPEGFSLKSAGLETMRGRDTVALERAENAIIVYMDDTLGGADTYEFKLHFHPTAMQPAGDTASPRAVLKIAARIDGSDCLKITATEASWQHKTWRWPEDVTLNGAAWNPALKPVQKNEGTNRFLPAGIDFSTARIVGRKGRDLATMWSDNDALWVMFADNPNGNDAYELKIAFGN